MTKIAFYGASVTQQRNGFVDHFAKLFKAKVLKFGFGGMHLSDAGICFIDKVVVARPEICFVDWFSTWYMDQDGKFDLYIDAIVEKLQKIDCRVIFLFFPQNKDFVTFFARRFLLFARAGGHFYLCPVEFGRNSRSCAGVSPLSG